MYFCASRSSKLDEDNLYMAYAGIMAKVPKKLYLYVDNSVDADNQVKFGTCYPWPHFFFNPINFQSCHDEEEDGEEVKSFEVGVQVSRSDRLSRWKSRLFQVSYRGLSCFFCIKRRRRWRSRSCCISRLDCMNVELQKWCFRPSAPAKVGFPLDVLQHTFYTGGTRTAALIGLRRNTTGGVFTKKQLVVLFFGWKLMACEMKESLELFLWTIVLVCT